MGNPQGVDVLGEGRFLRLVRRGHWEYVERIRPIRSVFIAAVTDDGQLLLTLEHRIPLGRAAVGFPAGLVGDIEGQEDEALEAATRRELQEEAGYEASAVAFLTQGPTSPGVTDEVIALMLATGLRKVGAGGGTEGESIALHEVPLGAVDGWLRARVAEGALVDPKVYTGLYFLAQSGVLNIPAGGAGRGGSG
jgi:ADP-ribose pyrophosphatase